MMALNELNNCSEDNFVRWLGPVFERSPWVGEITCHHRPFASVEALYGALCEVVRHASEEKQSELIQAHPDLVGRAASQGSLPAPSASEQASAGLDRLTSTEIEKFQTYNKAYREKFGFPFVICARLNKKEAILRGFELRLKNSREQEIQTALEEIYKIAYLRLQDIVQP